MENECWVMALVGSISGGAEGQVDQVMTVNFTRFTCSDRATERSGDASGKAIAEEPITQRTNVS
jgi:hypothetical protein